MNPVVKRARVLAEPIRCVRGTHAGGVLSPEHHPLAAGKPPRVPSRATQSGTAPSWAACCAACCKAHLCQIFAGFVVPPPQNARQISERSGPKGVGLSRETRGAEDPASASGTFQGPCFRPAPLLPCSPSAVDSSQLSLLPIKLIISPSSPCGHENTHHQSPLTLQLCSAALLFSSPS